jgi:hypothetical protein
MASGKDRTVNGTFARVCPVTGGGRLIVAMGRTRRTAEESLIVASSERFAAIRQRDAASA